MSDKSKHYSVSRAQWQHFGFHAVHSSRHVPVNQNNDDDVMADDMPHPDVSVRQAERVVEDA